MADNEITIESVIKTIEKSNDFNLDSIFSEYSHECIPTKLKTPAGDKAKLAKYESIDINLYEDKANMVAFHMKVDQILLWIKTLHIWYYDHLGNSAEQYISTRIIQTQGNAKDKFVERDFPILIALIKKIKEFNGKRVSQHNTPTCSTVEEGNEEDTLGKLDDDQTGENNYLKTEVM
ncbi:unnamed protein product [Mytilus coruscus]|uniref:Uncharacterized protein n=1 Tax=Mytilus coruscus TaxID=42192 RepID=A0A6J8BGC5_MYTCO|nr:unnamed protein product [Mytilus coruscus]